MSKIFVAHICGNCKKWLFGRCTYLNIDRDKNTISCGINIKKGLDKFKSHNDRYKKRNELFRRKK